MVRAQEQYFRNQRSGGRSVLAGHVAKVLFTPFPTLAGLDSIYFEIIPEPGGIMLLALGSLLLASKRLRMGS